MLDNNHECFSQPEANCTLWRYIDLTKLLALLETGQLLLPRADQFPDPYEGAWSRASIAMMRDPQTNGGIPVDRAEKLIAELGELRREMFISCWCASEHESAAMWGLYLQSAEGVAIRSDHDALCEALTACPLIARTSLVSYIDYSRTSIPLGNGFFPFVHKRKSFAHESELRAIIWSREGVNRPQIPEDATSVTVQVEPQDLIRAIHVSPTAPRWFGQLVERILRRYGVARPVVRSGLYDRPSW